MHEASIMQSLLEVAVDHLQKAGCTQIHTLRLRVGLLSGVMPEALEFAFDSLKTGTPAQTATLVIERIPALLSCPECRLKTQVDSMQFICPNCHGLMAVQEGGKELQLAEMDIS